MMKKKMMLTTLSMILVGSVLLLAGKYTKRVSADVTGKVVRYDGTVGNYKIHCKPTAKQMKIYITNKKTGKRKLLVAGKNVSARVGVAGKKVFYVNGKKLYSISVTGKNKKLIAKETIKENDNSIKLLNYNENCIYYSKATSASYEILKVYQYNIKTGKTKTCLKENFSFENELDFFGKYKYSYSVPTDIAGGYTLSVSKIASTSQKVIAKDVHAHIFLENKVQYVTQNNETGEAKVFETALNGEEPKEVCSFNIKTIASEKQSGFSFCCMQVEKMSADALQFSIDTGNDSHEYQYFYKMTLSDGTYTMTKENQVY